MDDSGPDSDPNSPENDPLRGRFERAISMAAPLFDLILAVGDRISRVAEPVDYEYYPVRDDDSRERGAPGGRGGDDPNR